MSTDYYRDKLVLEDHLNTPTYKQVDDSSDKKVSKVWIRKQENCLTKNEFKHISDFAYESLYIYVLPKIHKSKVIKEAVKNNNDVYRSQRKTDY